MGLNAKRRPLVTDGASGIDQLRDRISPLNNPIRPTVQAAPIRAELTGSDRCDAAGLTARTHTPVLSLCCALVRAGHDPGQPLEAFRDRVLALRVRAIGEAANIEINGKGTGFIKCRGPVGIAPPARFDDLAGLGHRDRPRARMVEAEVAS